MFFKIVANNIEAKILLGKDVKQKANHFIVSDEWGIRSVGVGRFSLFNYHTVDFTCAAKEVGFGR